MPTMMLPRKLRAVEEALSRSRRDATPPSSGACQTHQRPRRSTTRHAPALWLAALARHCVPCRVPSSLVAVGLIRLRASRYSRDRSCSGGWGAARPSGRCAVGVNGWRGLLRWRRGCRRRRRRVVGFERHVPHGDLRHACGLEGESVCGAGLWARGLARTLCAWLFAAARGAEQHTAATAGCQAGLGGHGIVTGWSARMRCGQGRQRTPIKHGCGSAPASAPAFAAS